MYTRGRNFVVTGTLLLCTASVNAATLTARAVAVNDAPIPPTPHVVVNPGDSVTVDFFLSGWEEDIAGSKLHAYQVALDGVVSYHSGTRGRLIPNGWDAVWPALCHAPDECPAATPFCNGLFGTCGCINGISSCPADRPLCAGGLCIGALHAPELGTFLDDQRGDFVFDDAQMAISAVRLPASDLISIWGAVALTADVDAADLGQAAYAGTHVIRVSDDACGTFTFSFGDIQQTFVLLRDPSLPPAGVIVAPSVDTVTIEIQSNGSCTPPIRLLGPRRLPNSLTRVRMNTIVLEFDAPLPTPPEGALVVSKLTDTLCAGGTPDADLAPELTIEVDAPTHPNRLIIHDPNVGTFENAAWYRIASPSGWANVEPFAVDFRVLIGDANSDGFINFSDLMDIFQSIPTLRDGINDSNRHKDVNADGFINFGDLSTVFRFVPETSAPYPCQ